MTKWEYAVVEINLSKDEQGEQVVVGWFVRKDGAGSRVAKTEQNTLVSLLDGLGANGWEAVSHSGVTVLLKRQVTPK